MNGVGLSYNDISVKYNNKHQICTVTMYHTSFFSTYIAISRMCHAANYFEILSAPITSELKFS